MGGHSSGGMFPGTSGSNLGRELLLKEPNANSRKNGSPKSPTAAPGLRAHVEKGSGVGRDGISGCHQKDNFERILGEAGGKITESREIPGIEGIEIVHYALPKKDREGKPTGEFKSKQYQKSVYDPSKISTDEYIRRGLEAASNPTSVQGRKWTGLDSNNVKWSGYMNDADEITSLYPVE